MSVNIERQSFSGRRVLVVDDETDLAELIGLEFEMLGAEVVKANSANQAIDILRQSDFDVIISDIRMPGGDGTEIIQDLRLRKKDSPVVLMSGYSDLTSEETFRLGAVAKLQKPFNRHDLISTVMKACLPIESRWTLMPSVAEVKHYSAISHGVASEVISSSVVFGKGGFYLATEQVLPKIDETVLLSVQVDEFRRMDIYATVRWTRHLTTSMPAGFGAEIVYIPSSDRDWFLQLIKDLDTGEFIPVPVK